MSKAESQSTTRRRPPSFQRYALCPKPEGVRKTTLPTFPEDCGPGLERFLGNLAPDERKALAAIVEDADLILVAGKAFLLSQVTAEMLDVLAAFGECEERENDLEDEPDEGHELDTCDTEPSLQNTTGAARRNDPSDRELDEGYRPLDQTVREERVALMSDWRRGHAEIRRLNDFLRRLGKEGVSTFSIVGRP